MSIRKVGNTTLMSLELPGYEDRSLSAYTIIQCLYILVINVHPYLLFFLLHTS